MQKVAKCKEDGDKGRGHALKEWIDPI